MYDRDYTIVAIYPTGTPDRLGKTCIEHVRVPVLSDVPWQYSLNSVKAAEVEDAVSRARYNVAKRCGIHLPEESFPDYEEAVVTPPIMDLMQSVEIAAVFHGRCRDLSEVALTFLQCADEAKVADLTFQKAGKPVTVRCLVQIHQDHKGTTMPVLLRDFQGNTYWVDWNSIDFAKFKGSHWDVYVHFNDDSSRLSQDAQISFGAVTPIFKGPPKDAQA